MSKQTIPDAIYLQWPENELEADDSLITWEDVTWADQQIDETDPKYLLATPVRESAEAMLQALKGMIHDWDKYDYMYAERIQAAREAIAAAEAGKEQHAKTTED